jgi:arabinose-5-phosphate isomerase
MSPKIIKLAQDVLNIEANEILKASDKISNEFSDAVECILRCEGRVILSGIGKSGSYCRKNSFYSLKYRNAILLYASW